MESAEATGADPLLSLRHSIASKNYPIPSTSTDPADTTAATSDLAIATHLIFTQPDQAFPLDTPTRFISSEKPVDLRSIFFAWQKKDDIITEYINSAQHLNDKLSKDGGIGPSLQHLIFVERLDLITWLEGASEESEYIRPLDAEATAAQAADSAKVASGAAGGVSTIPSGAARPGKIIDPRLQEIYNGERRMGDRNSVLRGIKPTDFSHVRKSAEVFLTRTRRPAPSTGLPTPSSGSLATHPKKPSRRPDPIILLSPSASSLLRMSNIKAFLESGAYSPPDTSSATANILHTSRLLPSIDPSRPLRFILVDTPEQFKPDYWERVVAVFTTGQTWQFKSYKWQSPQELFRHVLGVYVGWRGEEVPGTVRGWGRGVACWGVEKWSKVQGVQQRWRDREVVEGIWGAVEESMRAKGWGKEGGVGGR